MRSRILYTAGDGKFVETSWDKPEPTDNQIEVKAAMTGICRSDIDMMQGNFGPLPLHMQGHEGLGIVTKFGSKVNRQGLEPVKVGDFVATRGEPAYSDYYNTGRFEFVVVPELDPKWIIEPIACGINVATEGFPTYNTENKRLLILGSGFLSWIVFQTMLIHSYDGAITVVGNSNRHLWQDHIELSKEPTGQYDVVIDLKQDDTVFTKDVLKNNATVVLAAEKHPAITTSFANLLWKNCKISCPSPRNDDFYTSMTTAVSYMTNCGLQVDGLWTRGYNRNTEWQQAFEDGVIRSTGYSRGYLVWN